jgi:hypothetical protein
MLKRRYVLTPKKEQFIRDNYLKMTDSAIGRVIKAPRTTIAKWRTRLGLSKRGHTTKTHDHEITKVKKAVNLRRMSDEEKREFYLRQLRSRPRYGLMRGGLTKDELRFYEEKYVEYFSSPDIETITVQEEDDLHEMTMLQVRILRMQKEEYDSRASGNSGSNLIDNSKQIKEATELVMKFKTSLDLERKQRLKRQEDSATNFTTLIREINQNHTRMLVGEEATMLKFRTEEAVNMLVEHGLSHGLEKIKLEDNFINGKLPDDYKPPELSERQERNEQKKED